MFLSEEHDLVGVGTADGTRPAEDERGFYPAVRMGPVQAEAVQSVVDLGVLHEHDAAIAAGVATTRGDEIGVEELQRLAACVDRWRGPEYPSIEAFETTAIPLVDRGIGEMCGCGSIVFAEVRGFGMKRTGFARSPLLLKVTVCRLCGEVRA